MGASPHTPLAQLGPEGSRESARAGAEEGVVPMTGRKPGDAGSSRRPGASATPEQPKVRAAPGLEEARSPQRATLERPPVPTHGLGQSLTGGETTDSRRLRQRRGSVSSAGSCSCGRRARSIPTPTTPPSRPAPPRRLSRHRLRRRSRPLLRVCRRRCPGSPGVATGLAPRHCSRFSLALEAASGGDPPAAVPLRASVLALSTSPRVLEKRPRPGNGASRFQRLTAEVLIEFCVSSMRNYRLIFCHNLKQP